MENDIVQPDVDHVEEPVMEYGRPARSNLEQPPLSQELFQYRPRQRPVGDRSRVMRVEIGRIGLEGLDRFVIPSPKVILGSNDSISLST